MIFHPKALHSSYQCIVIQISVVVIGFSHQAHKFVILSEARSAKLKNPYPLHQEKRSFRLTTLAQDDTPEYISVNFHR